MMVIGDSKRLSQLVPIYSYRSFIVTQKNGSGLCMYLDESPLKLLVSILVVHK